MYITIAFTANAQTQWSSPEVEQMYRNAIKYREMGNLKDAITTYKQMLRLEPGKEIINRELGEVYYLSFDYKNAEETLKPLLEKHPSPELFDLVAAVQIALQHFKDASHTINEGLSKYPNSGKLYHESGIVYNLEKKQGDALWEWKKGIQHEPAFSLNYYEVAQFLTANQNYFAGLLCNELFINLEQKDTSKIIETKKTLLAGYKALFDGIANENTHNKRKKHISFFRFEDSAMSILLKLSPVISNGITTENLVMLRTRFLMEWFGATHIKYPFSLFTYQNDLIINGWFDIYNEWLFGKAEDELQYESWSRFHTGAIDSFINWHKANSLIPLQLLLSTD